MDDIFTDIFPDAVKIGMVPSSRLIEVIADKLSLYHGVNIAADPVMAATSGSRLIDREAVQTMTERWRQEAYSRPAGGCGAWCISNLIILWPLRWG